MRRLIAAVLAAALWVAVLSIAPSASATSPTPPTGKIAFASDRLAIRLQRTGPVCFSASCSDIYTVNADGTGLVKLTPTSLTGFENSPTWSPDGTRIMFERTFKGYQGHPSHQIYVMDANGSNITQLTFGNQLSVSPAWSPDGTTIALVRRPKEGPRIPYGHIAIMNPDGTGITEITSGADYDQRPMWSPDSTRIVFERDFACFCESAVYVMNDDGSGLTRLVNGWGPSWSPDGTKLAVWNYELGLLQTLDLASGTVTTLATAAGIGGDLADAGVVTSWSPDGQWVAVGGSGDVSFGVGLVLVSADGTTIFPVPNGEFGMGPAWQPAGSG